MRLIRVIVSLALIATLSGLAVLAQKAETPGIKMTAAAEKLIGSLNDDQKKKALFAYDSEERTNWNFIPLQDKDKKSTRKGVPLEDLSADQKKLALELLRTGVSPSGYEKATTIMSLEGILKELEKDGAMVRNPSWYFVTIFGKPSADGKWGWRIEGHHLSLNFVVDRGQIAAVTPAFFGANPATVKAGPKAGLRTLPGAEDHAIDLFKSLDEEQKKLAFKDKPFDEPEQKKAAPNPGKPQGVPAKKMTDEQKATLMKLLEDYTSRMPEACGKVELDEAKKAGIDEIHFAFSGGTEPGQPRTYRVQGPTFVVEFLNIQPDSAKNPANHIHSCWRRIHGDFGLGK